MVKTQKQLEGHDNMDLVILPPNTNSNIHRISHKLIETRIHQQDFKKKVQDILSIPGGNNNKDVKRQKQRNNEEKQNIDNENDNMAKIICLTSRIKKITKEISAMIKMMCMFCNCKNVEKKIEEYYEKNTTSAKRIKRFKTSLSILQNSYAIPLQLLDLAENTEECEITISKEVSNIFFSGILYQESLISQEQILEILLTTIDTQKIKTNPIEKTAEKLHEVKKDAMGIGQNT